MEDAFGQPILEELFAEMVASQIGLPGGNEWKYAPIVVTEHPVVHPVKNRWLNLVFDFTEEPSGQSRCRGHHCVWR